MSWADPLVERLLAGEVVDCRPRGHSMRGRIASGQRITLDPHRAPQIGDAVLCRCRGHHYVHLIKSVRGHDAKRRYLIGNNRGGINGWIPRGHIYGVVTHVHGAGDDRCGAPKNGAGDDRRGARKKRAAEARGARKNAPPRAE